MFGYPAPLRLMPYEQCVYSELMVAFLTENRITNTDRYDRHNGNPLLRAFVDGDSLAYSFDLQSTTL